MGTHWGRAGYRGEDSRGRKGSRVSLLSWNETLVRRRESAGRIQSGRLRHGLEEDARLPRQETAIIPLDRVNRRRTLTYPNSLVEHRAIIHNRRFALSDEP